MSQAVVAQRYAKAIFEIALESGINDQIEEELRFVEETFASSTELKEWLTYPFVDQADKKSVLANIFTKLSEPVKNLLFLLVDRHRSNLIDDIVKAYQNLNDEHKGLVEAIVTTAFPLSAEDEKQLIETFGQLTQKKLRLIKKIDSDLLGGVIVKIGDRLYDGSLRTKLQQFQKRLENAKVE